MRYIVSLFILFASLTSFSQEVEFKATAPAVIELGEQFRLTYTLNSAQGTNFQAPAFDNFDFLMGPSTSKASYITSINGHETKMEVVTYTCILEGVKVGKYTIQPASIVVNGKQYTTNAITIEVVPGGGQTSAQQQQGNNAQRNVSPSVAEENLFVEVDVSRRSLYMGESLVATLKLYTRVDISNLGPGTKFPSFDGFMAEEIPTPQRIEFSRQNYKGSVYSVGVIREMLLFPQHVGEIIIEPFELECIVNQQLTNSRSVFDAFFNNYREIKVKRASKPVKITVKELPHEGKPLGFDGAVGKITMRTFISTDSLKANEAITYKVTFSGNGNLKLLSAPGINFPPDFEVYDPKKTPNIHTDKSGMNGSVSYEYLLIPRYAGKYKIPVFTYSYFDPQAKNYKTLSGKEYNINVQKGEGSAAEDGGAAAIQLFKQEDVRYIGEDIRYIKTGDLALHDKGSIFYKTIGYWLGFIIPLTLFAGGVLLNRQRIKANADVIKVKNKAANKMARKRMRNAVAAMKNKNTVEFYNEILKGLWGYVSYKLNVDKAELNRDNISEILEKKAVDKTLIGDFIVILNQCEFACYAPGGSSAREMEEVYRESIMIITKLDKAIK